MFDLKQIRDNPEAYDSGWKRRGLDPQTPKIIEMDEKRRALQTEMQELQSKRNEASKQIGALKSKGGDATEIMAEVAGYKTRIAELEETEKKIAEELNGFLSVLPNIPDASVPDGAGEGENVEVRRHGEPVRLNSAKEHYDIGAALGGMDFETAAKMSGARFVLLKSGVARLERALSQFMLDTHTQEHGYTEMSVPLLVRDEALYGTGQLPKFAEDLFRTGTGHWLIPTSEVSLTNTVLDSILDAGDLPLRLTALTPCFRSEAGAAGKDTRGMIRQHQFYKVELVSITAEDQSMAELDRMTQCAETILQKLGLAYRTMALCTGDMGFSARKTYDIEVWLPGQNAYREISSCSVCGDFQARRMMARYRLDGEKQTRYVHTLNGSGVAVGRCLIAVLENYQQPDGSVLIPDVLQPYMGGLKKLEPVAETKAGKVA
ncbi:MAG TPA: serine--tRNA ligase [Alphaproteobacteria bacterium]|nr:serine--tRNA ligase [Alphaproteobacteria bacterium]